MAVYVSSHPTEAAVSISNESAHEEWFGSGFARATNYGECARSENVVVILGDNPIVASTLCSNVHLCVAEVARLRTFDEGDE